MQALQEIWQAVLKMKRHRLMRKKKTIILGTITLGEDSFGEAGEQEAVQVLVQDQVQALELVVMEAASVQEKAAVEAVSLLHLQNHLVIQDQRVEMLPAREEYSIWKLLCLRPLAFQY